MLDGERHTDLRWIGTCYLALQRVRCKQLPLLRASAKGHGGDRVD